MKQIIVVLGIVASTGCTFFHLTSSSPISSSSSSSIIAQKIWAQDIKQYEGTDEDGNREDIPTGKKTS